MDDPSKVGIEDRHNGCIIDPAMATTNDTLKDNIILALALTIAGLVVIIIVLFVSCITLLRNRLTISYTNKII